MQTGRKQASAVQRERLSEVAPALQGEATVRTRGNNNHERWQKLTTRLTSSG